MLRLMLHHNTIPVARWMGSNVCDCWSLPNGNHTTITRSILLAGVSGFYMFDPRRHDIPSHDLGMWSPPAVQPPLPLTSDLWHLKSNHAWLGGGLYKRWRRCGWKIVLEALEQLCGRRGWNSWIATKYATNQFTYQAICFPPHPVFMLS